MGLDRRIGERSTHEVMCTLCNARFGNACEHECTYVGRGLKRYLDRLEQRILELEEVIAAQRQRPDGSTET